MQDLSARLDVLRTMWSLAQDDISRTSPGIRTYYIWDINPALVYQDGFRLHLRERSQQPPARCIYISYCSLLLEKLTQFHICGQHWQKDSIDFCSRVHHQVRWNREHQPLNWKVTRCVIWNSCEKHPVVWEGQHHFTYENLSCTS